ncbi:non-canonical purine NTP pyrophosphatase [Candidatus Saccharibacteria bacterium]|nr:non-canonical purine NTP pyrophosphatase [Candidatus Saccharibacteria bacterium]
MKVTFITGNQNKADFLAKYLEHELEHVKLELDELQSLDLREITEHKVRQAYEKIGSAVLVEDIAFSLDALGGKLPGPLVKWFIDEMGLDGLCRILDSFDDKGATTTVCYAYFDGNVLKFFEGSLHGTVPEKPRGEDGFGWNAIFIPDGQTKTNAEMNEEETKRYSLRTATVYPKIKEFLSSLDTK